LHHEPPGIITAVLNDLKFAVRSLARSKGLSVPEIRDFQERIKTLSAFGDFSTVSFTMVGLGDPRVVRVGVVGGSYFDVTGLRPVLGRLLDARDDGSAAAGAAVLTYRFLIATSMRRASLPTVCLRDS
jgi:hypothetical protein